MDGVNGGRSAGPAPETERGPVDFAGIPPLRLAVGLGDPERERELLPALGEAGDLVVAERCLAADQLLESAQTGRIDAILLASDLHRLSGGTLAELVRTRVPLVVLAPQPDEPRWQGLPAVVLPLGAGPETVREAIEAAVRGERPRMVEPLPAPDAEPAAPKAPVETGASALAVLAVASGHGSPGRTVVALSLAAALGAVAPTVLVDADLSGPSLAAYLDADPTRNLYMLAHAEPDAPREWERAIEQETQPLAARSPHGAVLCGVPKPEMRTGISARFFERLVAELQRRYRYVILDVGADLLGSEAALHRAALGLAGQVLLVASADLVGLWHARTALGLLRTHLQLGPERVALIINRHDRRYHHGRAEIEWALGVATAAVIPYDHGGAQRALAAQRPLVLAGRSRAGRALLDLAERVHGGDIALPPEPARDRRPGWFRRAVPLRLACPRRTGRAEMTEGGRSDGDRVNPVA